MQQFYSPKILIAILLVCTSSKLSARVDSGSPIFFPVDPHEALLKQQPEENQLYSSNGKIDSAIYWEWDSIGQAWFNTTKSHYTWDANVNLLEKKDFFWNGSSWQDTTRSTYAYDGNNNLVETREYKWLNNNWDLRRLTENTYDSLNNITLQTDSIAELIFWKYYQYIYTYNMNHDCYNIKRQLWNVTMWQNSENYNYTYDLNHNMLSRVKQFWNLGGWSNQYNYLYTYDVNNSLTTFTLQNWDVNAWENMNLYTYSYDVNLLLSGYTIGSWMGNSWYTSHRFTNTYNFNLEEVNRLYEKFNGQNWYNFEQYMHTYDINNDSSSRTDQVWRSTVWQNSDSAHFYFSPLSGIDEPDAFEISLEAYPNPAHDYFTLSSREDLRNSTVEVFDVTGKKVYSGLINTSDEKIYCHWDAGIYFVQVKTRHRTGLTKLSVR